jgi:hypothetical protein
MQRHKFVFAALVIGLATLLTASSIARADVVTDWNAIASQTAIPALRSPHLKRLRSSQACFVCSTDTARGRGSRNQAKRSNDEY